MFISQVVVTLSDDDLTAGAKTYAKGLPVKIRVADDHLIVTGLPLTGLKLTPRLEQGNRIACRLGATSPLVPDGVAAQAVTSLLGKRLPPWLSLEGRDLYVDVAALLATTPVRGQVAKLRCLPGWLEVTVRSVQVAVRPK